MKSCCLICYGIGIEEKFKVRIWNALLLHKSSDCSVRTRTYRQTVEIYGQVSMCIDFNIRNNIFEFWLQERGQIILESLSLKSLWRSYSMFLILRYHGNKLMTLLYQDRRSLRYKYCEIHGVFFARVLELWWNFI